MNEVLALGDVAIDYQVGPEFDYDTDDDDGEAADDGDAGTAVAAGVDAADDMPYEFVPGKKNPASCFLRPPRSSCTESKKRRLTIRT